MASMVPLKGTIRDGWLRVAVPVDLPDGDAELDFVRVTDPSDLDDQSRAKLDASLDRASAQIEAGQGIPGEEFFKKLRERR
jgi:hypothetical protein